MSTQHDEQQSGPAYIPMRMSEKIILNVVARTMIPFILLFGFYVQFHGDFGPGGGFQAGVILAAGFVLFGLVFGNRVLEKVLPVAWVEAAIAIGLLLYGGVGVTSMFLGADFLDYNVLGEHGQHRGILLIEAGVGITVSAAMTRFFYAFSSLTSAFDSAGNDGVSSK